MSQDRGTSLLIISVIFVLLAGFIQNTDWAVFFGVKINLILVLIITLGLFIRNPWHYIALAILGAILLKPSGWDKESSVLLVLLTIAPYCKKYLFGQPAFNNVFLILIATIVFYLIINPGFLTGYPATVLLELIYNLIAGSILYIILEKKYAVYT